MKMTEKRTYQAPKIEKVRLTVKNSVLGTCHVSPLPTAFSSWGCDTPPFTGCYEGPGGAPIG